MWSSRFNALATLLAAPALAPAAPLRVKKRDRDRGELNLRRFPLCIARGFTIKIVIRMTLF